MFKKRLFYILFILLGLFIFTENVNAAKITNYKTVKVNSNVEGYGYSSGETYLKFQVDSDGIMSLNNYHVLDTYLDDYGPIDFWLYSSDYSPLDLIYPMSKTDKYTKYLTAGTYYLGVTCGNGGRTYFSFDINFTKYKFLKDNIPLSTSMKSAYKLEENFGAFGTVDTNRSDFYQIKLDKPSRVNNNLVISDDVKYYVYDKDGVLVYSKNFSDCVNGFNYVLNAGTYYVKISKSSTLNETVRYKFSYKLEKYEENCSEPNDTIKTPKAVKPVIKGVLALNDEEDFYRYYTSTPGKLKIKVQSFTDYENDIKIEIYDKNYKLFNYWDFNNSKGKTNKGTIYNINVIIPKGTYYIKVSKRIGTGKYILTLGDNKDKVVLGPPEMDYKADLKSQEGSVAYTNKVVLNIGCASEEYNADYFEIYRSTKIDSGYELIKTIKNKNESSENGCTVLFKYIDTNLKANTKYYYKVRAKKVINHVVAYGPYSVIRSYWTAVPKKVTITTNNMTKAGWKKVTGATGYVVFEEYSMYQGVNIFGQDVYYGGTASSLINKTTYNRQYKYISHSGKASKSKVSVRAYTKRGSLYLVEGEIITTDKYKYVYSTGDHYYA